jgi:hypothetical protein
MQAKMAEGASLFRPTLAGLVQAMGFELWLKSDFSAPTRSDNQISVFNNGFRIR